MHCFDFPPIEDGDLAGDQLEYHNAIAKVSRGEPTYRLILRLKGAFESDDVVAGDAMLKELGRRYG